MPSRFRRGRLVLRVLAVGATTALALAQLRDFRPVTDLTALLPESSDAARAYGLFFDTLGGSERILVLVRSVREEENAPRLVDAACRLAGELTALPTVRSASCGLEEADLDFLARHVLVDAPLFLGPDWRSSIQRRTEPAAVRARAALLRRRLTAPLPTPRPWLAADPLGLGEDLIAEGLGTGLPVDPLTLGFSAPDGRSALVVVTPELSELDAEGGRRLLDDLAAGEAALRETTGGDLRVDAVGGPLYAARDEAAFRTDLRRTLSLSAIGCVLVIGLAFQGVLLPVTLGLSLALGLLWTAGALDGALNGITGLGFGFAAVLLGLGIDVGVHAAGRFQRERQRGAPAAEALSRIYSRSGRGILTAVLSTAVAFSALAWASLRPLRELGLGVAFGLLLILAAAAAVGPLLLASRGRRGGPPLLWRAADAVVAAALRLARYRRAVLLGAGILTAAGLYGAARLRLEVDLAALRPADERLESTERLLARSYSAALEATWVLVPGATLPAALTRATAAAQAVRRHAPAGSDVQTPSRWLASSETARARLADPTLRLLGPAADQLSQELRAAGLDPSAFEDGLSALRRLAAGEAAPVPVPETWPAWLRDQVRVGLDGHSWVALALRTPHGSWPDGPPPGLVADLERAAPGSAVASTARLGAELRRAAESDLRRLAALALVLVAAVVLVSFRFDPAAATLAVLPALLGACWTLGLWSLAGRPLGLLDVAVLPVLLGIGLDDGLHALHEARRAGTGLAQALEEVGAPIVLTTTTTAVGFGSLAVSSSRSLAQAGLLVAAGVTACLAATLLCLPALRPDGPDS